MILGIVLNFVCILVALSGVEVYQFLISSFILGVGWNFLFTGATSLAMTAYRPEEKDKAQGIINFFIFATMAITSFSSGALVTTSGWDILNIASLFPVILMGVALIWLRHKQNQERKLAAI
jgi:MFS family permease